MSTSSWMAKKKLAKNSIDKKSLPLIANFLRQDTGAVLSLIISFTLARTLALAS